MRTLCTLPGVHAVILAGGRGTRLRPLTDDRPKPLLPFLGAPFAAGLLRRLADTGCDRASVLVGADPEPFLPLVGLGEEVGVAVAVETEPTPLDTAGAARRLLARGVGDPVLVCNGDILTDLDYGELVQRHRAAGATATLALTTVDDTSSFGVVVCDPDGRVRRFVEKPPPGTLPDRTVNAGTYVLAADAFAAFPGDGPLSFEKTVFPGLLEAGATVLGVTSEAYWQDLGTPARYLSGHWDALEGRCAWPRAEALTVSGDVAVHADAEVDAAADLRRVVVGPGAAIAAGAALHEVVVHEDVVVGAGARVNGAILGRGSRVADGAVVPAGAVLGAGALVPA